VTAPAAARFLGLLADRPGDRRESQHKPSLLETMFACHPMSEERYQTARRVAEKKYAGQRGRAVKRERYLDTIAGLRRIQATVESCQQAKALLAQKKNREAERYLASAKSLYPGEAQAVHLAGLAKLALKQPDAALAEFRSYDKLLPGNPATLFFMGAASENMGRQRDAANYYYRYVQTGAQGGGAQFAVNRLRDWKVIR
jgi:tetratricopeptide (TPR) repeat protein